MCIIACDQIDVFTNLHLLLVSNLNSSVPLSLINLEKKPFSIDGKDCKNM